MIRTTSGFSLAHVLSDFIEGEGFMTYAAASPPGVKRDIWVSHLELSCHLCTLDGMTTNCTLIFQSSTRKA